jgi:hypothetical protein
LDSKEREQTWLPGWSWFCREAYASGKSQHANRPESWTLRTPHRSKSIQSCSLFLLHEAFQTVYRFELAKEVGNIWRSQQFVPRLELLYSSPSFESAHHPRGVKQLIHVRRN